jgi:Flp pilus assembly pilin Flp
MRRRFRIAVGSKEGHQMFDRLNGLFISAMTRLQSEEKGQAVTEYALVLAIVAIGVITTLAALKTGLITKIGNITSSIGTAG